MYTIGLTYLAVLAILLIPLLPFVAIIWAERADGVSRVVARRERG
jgi:hypothetical protein